MGQSSIGIGLTRQNCAQELPIAERLVKWHRPLPCESTWRGSVLSGFGWWVKMLCVVAVHRLNRGNA